MSATVKREPTLFRWSVQDGRGANGKLFAKSYRSELEGVFARAGVKWVHDRNGLLVPVGHSVLPFAVLNGVGGTEVLLLEPATTNYFLNSQDFSAADWNKTNITVTTNAVAAPDGTVTADKVAATASAATLIYQVSTTIATTVATLAVYAKMGSGATDANQFILWNATTAAVVAQCSINYSTGVVTVVSGNCRAVALGNGWYRIELTAASGITSGDDLRGYIGFTGSAETAGEYAYFWQADLTPDAGASTPIPTAGATVARAADSLYFPFATAPREMTIYVRGIERLHMGLVAATTGLMSITDAVLTDAKAYLRRSPPSPLGYKFQHDPATNTETNGVGSTAVVGDEVELRCVLGSDGAPSIGVSINSGAESTNGPATAQALAATWSAQRLYVNSIGSGNVGAFGFRQIVIAAGTKTMAEMRALAEVG